MQDIIIMSCERPTWNEYFKTICVMTSTRSACKKLHVGCLLVKNNRIISQGYNGYLPGCSHKQVKRDGHEVATVHAEQNAITDCAKRGVSCDESTAFITHYPCLNCLKLLIASGINKIYYINDYHNDILVPQFAKESNITISQI